MESPFPFHPLAVHLALSSGLFSAAVEILPSLKQKISESFRRMSLRLTLLFLAISLLTGTLSLSEIKGRHVPLPAAVSVHAGAALTSGALFLLLGLIRERETVSVPVRRLIAAAVLLVLLSAATLGGHLVYEDRMGTSYMAAPGPLRSPPSSAGSIEKESRPEGNKPRMEPAPASTHSF